MFSIKLIRWCFLLSMIAVLIVLSHTHLLSVNQPQASPHIVSSLDRLNDVDLSVAQGQVGIGVMDLNTGETPIQG